MKHGHTLRLALLGWALVLAACNSSPPAPEWKVQAHDAATQAGLATLNGRPKEAALQWQRARDHIRRTAQAAQLVRLELIRCAIERASWAAPNCPAFEAMRPQASDEDQAYARYLMGQTEARDIALLPLVHRPLATRLLTPVGPAETLSTDAQLAKLIAQMDDPLSRLVAAHAALNHRSAGLFTVEMAVNSASEQGWSQALMGWLSLQQRLAQERGDAAQATAAKARLQLLLEPLPTR